MKIDEICLYASTGDTHSMTSYLQKESKISLIVSLHLHDKVFIFLVENENKSEQKF